MVQSNVCLETTINLELFLIDFLTTNFIRNVVESNLEISLSQSHSSFVLWDLSRFESVFDNFLICIRHPSSKSSLIKTKKFILSCQHKAAGGGIMGYFIRQN